MIRRACILRCSLLACAATLAACGTLVRESPDSPAATTRRQSQNQSKASIPESIQHIGVTIIPAPDNPTEFIAVLYVFNSRPSDIIREISQLFAVRAAWESETYRLILRGTPESLAPALDLVLHLEEIPSDRDYSKIFVKHLVNARAAATAATLQSMVANQFNLHNLHPLVIIPDPRTNSLVIATETSYEDRLRSIIDELDRSQNPSTQPAAEIRIQNQALIPRD